MVRHQFGQVRANGVPSVAYFAEQLHLSPNYFGDLVKKDTGKSPQEHIQFKLLEVAKQQLMNPDFTIAEVAYAVGFAQPQHFSRMFKREVGMTPNAYRSLS